MTPHNIIKLVSKAAPHFDHLPWISSYISSKNRMYPLTLDLFFKGKAPNKFPRLLTNFVKSIAWAVREISFSIYAKFLFRRKKKYLDELQDKENVIIIKSFAYDSSIKGEDFLDPFFKDLIPLFKDMGYEVLFVVDSLTKWENLVTLKEAVIPYQYFYSPKEILKSLNILLKEALSFPSKKLKAYMKRGEQEKNLTKLYQVELLNPQTLINLLFYFSGLNLAKKYKNAKSFLYTYENNCWERTFTFGIKSSNPKSKVYAFQHAVMPQASVNMYVGEEEKKLVDFTDIIFTTGKYPESLFFEFSSISKEKFKTIGTARFNYLHELEPLIDKEFEYEFLIALEGVPQAAEVIERFYKQCLRENKSPKTLLRLHPAFGVNKMQKYLSFDISTVDFIEVSKSKTVVEDIKKSQFLIYWGSTCSLEALKLGKTIIHCKIESDLDFDPLGGLTDNRYVWEKSTSLFKIRKNILESNNSSEGVEKGIHFVENYFEKLRDIKPYF